MNINKNNYEAFFLDYHEGNLSPQQVADLLLFVEQHPELKEEFESFEDFILEDFSSIEFENKDSLKKDLTPTLSKGEGEDSLINFNNKDDYFIRSVEKDLNPAEENLLTNFIKQHPQFLNDLELFRKTKLSADNSISFENKDQLKRSIIPALSASSALRAPSPKEKEKGNKFFEKADFDSIMIASLEGLLSTEETVLLNQQLVADAKLKHEFSLYQQTKLIADSTLVFENKEELKRDLTPTLSPSANAQDKLGEGEYCEKGSSEKKVIPLFYYVAIAASLLLLIGLSYMYNSNNNDEKFANELNIPKKQIQNNTSNTNTFVKENTQETKGEDPNNRSGLASKNSTVKKQKNNPLPVLKNNSSNPNPIITTEEQKENIAQNKNENKKIESIADNSLAKSVTQPAQINKNDENTKPNEFISLGQLAAEKIKEKTLDNNTLAIQKKNGRLKKFSGWDVAQIITKGISKLTGRNIEVKPTYNDEGEVTAYALGNGIEVTRGR